MCLLECTFFSILHFFWSILTIPENIAQVAYSAAVWHSGQPCLLTFPRRGWEGWHGSRIRPGGGQAGPAFCHDVRLLGPAVSSGKGAGSFSVYIFLLSGEHLWFNIMWSFTKEGSGTPAQGGQVSRWRGLCSHSPPVWDDRGSSLNLGSTGQEAGCQTRVGRGGSVEGRAAGMLLSPLFKSRALEWGRNCSRQNELVGRAWPHDASATSGFQQHLCVR